MKLASLLALLLALPLCARAETDADLRKFADLQAKMTQFRRTHGSRSKWSPEDVSQWDDLQKQLTTSSAVDYSTPEGAAKGRVEEFLAEHPDRSKWLPEDEQAYMTLVNDAKEPAAPAPKAPLNTDCAFAARNVAYAVPGALADSDLWKEDGRLRLPNSNAVLSNQNVALAQTVTTLGGGMLFAHDAGPKTRTTFRLNYDPSGNLTRLQLGAAGAKLSETIDYDHDGSGCRLKRVVVNSPDLKGKQGVAFDEKLCASLDKQGLLVASAFCGAYNQKVGAAIDKFSSDLPNDEAFALFTTAPDGSVKLRQYQSHDYPMANAAVANDCLMNWKPAKASGQDAPDPSPIDGGVERGAPAGIAAPAP